MAHATFDRVLESSTTTGTGAFTLAGAVLGHITFASKLAVADTCHYMINAVDVVGRPTGEWELGRGTYSAANTLTRTTVIASSNGGAAVNFSAGTKYVALTVLAPSTTQLQADWRAAIGLNLVNNTADASKPVSTAQQAALDTKFDKTGGTTTGSITVSTAGDANLVVNAPSSSYYALVAFRLAGVSRWALNQRKDSTDFVVDRHNSSGTWINAPIRVDSASGNVFLNEASSAWTYVTNRLQATDLVATGQVVGAYVNSTGTSEASYMYSRGDITAAGTIWANYGYRWASGVAGPAVRPNDGSYQVTGPYRYNMLADMSPGQGDVGNMAFYHQPGVESFWQMNIGGGGNYVRFTNNGWGSSNAGWTTHSDARVKANFEDLTNVLEAIEDLFIGTYEKTDGSDVAMEGPSRPKRHLGMLGQQLRTRFPQVVKVGSGPIGSGITDFHSVDYGLLGPVALAACRELNAKLKRMEERLKQLEH